jgi:predicted metalloprotease with PDZ domain
MLPARRFIVALVLFLSAVSEALAQAAVAYRLSFAERAHRLMHVEVTFTDVPAGPLQLRMSRSSPGRYALHEFAKNVIDLKATDADGRPLTIGRPNPHQWDVSGHTGTVRVTYRIFGDRIDGTYLAVDAGHAHINMPAALMWAQGFENHPSTVRFEPPPGAGWRVATQLFPGSDPFSFNAPNLQYLMDSPSEFSSFALRTFTVPGESRTPVFRLAIHHAGGDGELDAFARDVEAIVKEARHVFREYPLFEGNTYTFIADYLPWANSDGMEHRNSTILTDSSSIVSDRADLLDTIAHEFFHAWNVERIRPRSLEPFNFDDTNMSDELWLAEGFTSYYAPLITTRAGLTDVSDFARDMGRKVDTVITSPGRRLRSAVEMSQQAPFVDAATSIDRNAQDNTFISYYTWGAAIGLGLDLTLRDRSDGRVTLDDYMRVLWERHGKAGGTVTGSVARPYTMDDLKSALTAITGDEAFTRDFFARYIEGRDVVDYARLLARAGLVLRPVSAGRASLGLLRLQDGQNGVRLIGASPFGSPAYEAGLDRDDVIVSIGGTRVSSVADVDRVLGSRKPGDGVPIVFDRRGQTVKTAVVLGENQRREIVTAEEAGQPVSDAQKRFRDAWLRSPTRNVF